MDKTETPMAVGSSERLGVSARWYCVSRDGRATLCTCEQDAKENVASQNIDWPHSAPHRAVQLVDAAEVESLKLAEEGAKEAFGHVVEQKQAAEAECVKLRELLDAAYSDIRRMSRAVEHHG